MRVVKDKKQSLGLTFARSLPLRRVVLSQAIQQFAMHLGSELSQKDLYNFTDLGSIEAQASKRWLIGFNIVENDELTSFGKLINDFDPTIQSLSSQWICHYHLLCENGPIFWRPAWDVFLGSTEGVAKEKIIERIEHDFLCEGNKAVSTDTYEKAVRCFINAYTSPDGLGRINLFEEVEADKFGILNPSEIPWRAFAYILADFWEANWGATLSVPFADLSSESGPGQLLFLNSGQIGGLLRSMQEAGLVEVSRVARPWTVLRKWQSKEALLEAVYDDADAE